MLYVKPLKIEVLKFSKPTQWCGEHACVLHSGGETKSFLNIYSVGYGIDLAVI
jgi:hypothetical protein